MTVNSDPSQDKQVPPSPDSISLIDLFSVVLRWRVLILVPTAFVVVVVVVIVGILPLAGIKLVETRPLYEARAELRFRQANPSVSNYFSNYAPVTQSWLKSTAFIAPKYASHIIAALPEHQKNAFDAEDEVIGYVQKSVLDKTFKIAYDAEAGILSLSFVDPNAEAAAAFINALTSDVLTRIQSELGSEIKLALEVIDASYNALMEGTKEFKEQALGTITALRERRIIVERIAKDTSLLVMQQGEVSVAPSELSKSGGSGLSSPLIIAIMVVFGTFSAFILLAFVLEYIRKVKADPVQMQKLRRALNKE